MELVKSIAHLHNNLDRPTEIRLKTIVMKNIESFHIWMPNIERDYPRVFESYHSFTHLKTYSRKVC